MKAYLVWDAEAAEGVFMADGEIVTPAQAGPFEWQGVFVAGRFNLQAEGGTEAEPAETFTYRPDFLLSAPDELKVGGHLWQELAP